MIKEKGFSINGRQIGLSHPPYVIAELSANHNGKLDNALRLIELAKDSGVDAVKIQTYTADTITIKSNRKDFIIKQGPWAGKNLYELYEWAHTPWDWHEAIFERGRDLGLTVFSSPFDKTAVDFLEQLNTPAYKIASFELVDTPLIEYAASKDKPIIISTGMANYNEIDDAVSSAKSKGLEDVALLHCTSGYPTPFNQSDLRTISELRKLYNLTIGLSDHSLESAVPIAASALGASIIEKHFISSRSNGGADSGFSLEPSEMSQLVKDVNIAWQALGEVRKERAESEKTQIEFRRSLYVVSDVKADDIFTEHNTRSIRPGFGIKPKYLNSIIGEKASMDISSGTALDWNMVKKS